MTNKLLLRVTLCGFLSAQGVMNAMESAITEKKSGFSAALCTVEDAGDTPISDVRGFVSNLVPGSKKNMNLSLDKEGHKHKLPITLANIVHLGGVAKSTNDENALVHITHGKNDKQAQHFVKAADVVTAMKNGLHHAKPVKKLIDAHSGQTKSELKSKIAGLAVAVKSDAKKIETGLADELKKEETKKENEITSAIVTDAEKALAPSWFNMGSISTFAQAHKPKIIGTSVVATFMALLGFLQKYGHIDLSKLYSSKA